MRSQNYDDLELMNLLLAVLRGTGRHTILTQYIEEYLASLITQPQKVMCWESSDFKVSNVHNIPYAIAVVGDSVCLFMSAPKKETPSLVSDCILEALESELRNSAPRDMSELELDDLVARNLARHAFCDFVKGGSTAQVGPQCEAGNA